MGNPVMGYSDLVLPVNTLKANQNITWNNFKVNGKRCNSSIEQSTSVRKI